MERYKVFFQPGDLELEIEAGSTIMKAMDLAGIEFDFPCGGRGRCGKCRVKILQGMEPPSTTELEMLDEKELDEGIRLACLTKINQDLKVELPFKLEHKILLATEERNFTIEPHIIKTYVEIENPSLEDVRPDWTRLKESVMKRNPTQPQLSTSVDLLRQLPETLREAKNCVTAVSLDNKIIGLEAQNTTETLLGMAFDIGTTTIVGYLINLSTGQELSVVSTLNPQTKFGADVISRITFTMQEKEGLEKLHDSVITAINTLIADAAKKAGVNTREIYAVTIAGNSTIHHLFLGLSPKYIALSPYIPVVSEEIVVEAKELKISINPGGRIFVLPNIAGFVGADTVAVLLATEMDKAENIRLIIDIGTNGEIALGSKDRVFACSAAAGPAFEGAQISSGMRGAIGAIDHFYFNDAIEYSIIGEVKPKGICGSALLDAVAGLLELGIVDFSGRILDRKKINNPEAEKFLDRIVEHEGSKAFLLVDGKSTEHGGSIFITQRDIRELQMAKGAMSTGVKVLLEKYGIEASQVDEVLLAGAFGNYLNPHSACVIGLIPKELESKIKMIGNAAGTGSKLALLSKSEFKRSAAIAESVQFIELGSYPNFTAIFAESMYFRQ